MAADPLYLDYGTRVFVPGYGLSVIDDTGGAMRRQWRRNGQLHIDVRMTYHYEARQWGKQYLPVKIYVRE
ncbi:MAG: 3D domain-containing protein [Planctomycetes bacterium]|nr:3D domain-containing protein [Planctomycetota bacterium]